MGAGGAGEVAVDRFAGLWSQIPSGDLRDDAVVIVKKLTCTGPKLRVSVDAMSGHVGVGLHNAPIEGFGIDDTVPFESVAVTDAEVAFPKSATGDLSAFVGKEVQIKFRFRSATIFSFSFTDGR